jgi:hypothetical protein
MESPSGSMYQRLYVIEKRKFLDRRGHEYATCNDSCVTGAPSSVVGFG